MKKNITKTTIRKAIANYAKTNGINYGALNPREQTKVDREVAKILGITLAKMNDITLG